MENIDDFNIGDTIYLNQNYCDRFVTGHFSIDKPYEIKKIYYNKISRNDGINFFGSTNVHQYIIIHGHGITPYAIDYKQTRRINNLNKLLCQTF